MTLFYYLVNSLTSPSIKMGSLIKKMMMRIILLRDLGG